MRDSLNIVVSLPLNDALTNLLIYDGLVYLMSKVPAKVGISGITIPADALAKVYSGLSDETIKKINVTTVGKNDDKSIERFLAWLGINGEELKEKLKSLSSEDRQRKEKSKVTNYRELLYILNRSPEKIRVRSDSIFIGATIRKNHMIIGDVKDDKGLALQLLKSERYSGLTSTEHKYTSRQLTTYASPEVLMLALLGMYSSFVYRSGNTYYFLFLSPDEIGEILFLHEKAETIILIKGEAREVLEQILKKHFKEELIAVEVCLNTKLQEALSKHNVRSISLLLLRVEQEGQTYKVYESIPLTIFSRKDREPLIVIEKIIEPGSIVLDRLRNSDSVEYNNLISVIVGLYRFVILEDSYGIYQALRELHNAYIKVRSDEKLGEIARRYETLLRGVSGLERYL